MPDLTLDQLLDEARAGLDRLDPHAAARAARDGALLIDMRSDAQRAADGTVPGAIFIQRNVLEWRCAPASPWRDQRLGAPGPRLVLLCHEGYQSSLAAATLQRLGCADATDVQGGFTAWRAAGLPVTPPRRSGVLVGRAGLGRLAAAGLGRRARPAAVLTLLLGLLRLLRLGRLGR